jgi:hypothetical protein
MKRSSHSNTAAKLNNEAVLRIATFDYTAACDLLCNALEFVNKGVKEDQSLTDPRDSSEHQEIQQTSGAGPETHYNEGHVRLESQPPIDPPNFPRSDEGPPPTSHQHDAESTASSCCIHHKPIEIQELPSSGISADDYSRLSQAVVFNLALVYHLTALNENIMLSGTIRRDATLQKAIKLYELSHRLLCDRTFVFDDEFHLMATLSNLAHVHHLVGNERKAEHCCQNLLACIMYRTEYGDDDTHAFQKFFPAVKHLILQDSHTAAGA